MSNFRNSFIILNIWIFILQACLRSEVESTPSTVEEYTAFPKNNSQQTSKQYSSNFAWFYKPPVNNGLSLLPSRFDFYILTHRDEDERDTLRALGVDTPIPNYLLFAAIQDPGDCEKRPWGNQVAYLPGDFCKISVEHPDWFLLDTFGVRIKSNKNFYSMDMGNPEFQEFWFNRSRDLQIRYGWNGVFLDNVEASLSEHILEGKIPAKYPTDKSIQAAVEGFLSYLQKQNIGPLYANIIAIRNRDIWLSYISYLDGAMLENFAVDWKGGDLSYSEWVEEQNMMLTSQYMEKKLILVSQGDQDDFQRQQFAYASYLLVNDGLAYFRYALNHYAYDEVWWYGNYDLDFGRSLGPAYNEGRVWIRDFENGQVRVYPDEVRADIILYNTAP